MSSSDTLRTVPDDLAPTRPSTVWSTPRRVRWPAGPSSAIAAAWRSAGPPVPPNGNQPEPRIEADLALVREPAAVAAAEEWNIRTQLGSAAHALFESSPCGIAVITLTGTVVDGNPTLCAVTGRGRHELLGAGLGEALGLQGLFIETLTALHRNENMDSVQVEREARHVSGEPLSLEMTISPLGWSVGLGALYTVQILDVTTQRRAERQLEISDTLLHAATHDYLTGLWNRRTLESTPGSVVPGEDRMVLFIDLDGFKSVNDSHGHSVGDEVLVFLSRRLRSFVGDDGVACRWGGDEFVAVVSLRPGESATEVARRLRTLLEQSVRTSAGVIQVGASVGTATMRSGEEVAGAIARADAAAYTNKRAKAASR